MEFSSNDHSVWSVAGSAIGADVLIDTRDDDGDPIVREEVRYTLDWHRGETRLHPDGGWTVRNDLGYDVHVTGGRLVTRNLELIPCHALADQSARARLLRWLEPTAALAGHSSLTPNESKISDSFEEDLSKPERTFLEGQTVTDREYFRAHYPVARPTGTGSGARTLEVEGRWIREADGANGAFDIRWQRSSTEWPSPTGAATRQEQGLCKRLWPERQASSAEADRPAGLEFQGARQSVLPIPSIMFFRQVLFKRKKSSLSVRRYPFKDMGGSAECMGEPGDLSRYRN